MDFVQMSTSTQAMCHNVLYLGMMQTLTMQKVLTSTNIAPTGVTSILYQFINKKSVMLSFWTQVKIVPTI